MTGLKAEILAGSLRPLGPRGVPSGIVKTAIAAPMTIGAVGLEGDAQGDLRNHGGPEKAVHHYPFDHYAAWRGDLGEHALLTVPGAFGENVSTSGLTEDAVAVGDVFSLGGAVVEVSQGRQPCWKLSERFAEPSMAKRVQESGRTGWYYRVLQPGTVSPRDEMTLVERRSPGWTIARIWRAFYVDTMNPDELAGLAELPGLAESWKKYARRRLETKAVEDWSKRLTGKESTER